MGHIFYNTIKISLEDKINIINDAYKVNNEWWVDKLDCSESWSRQKIDLTYDEIMDKFENKSHFTVIERNNIIEGKYGEVSFSTTGIGIKYHLWIKISVLDLEMIIDKFNLISKL